MSDILEVCAEMVFAIPVIIGAYWAAVWVWIKFVELAIWLF